MVQLVGNSRRANAIGARQIYESIREQILGGAYGTDGPLPSSRALALELGVSRTTVTVAYEQLLAEGFIEGRQGARPRVAAALITEPRTRDSSALSQAIPLSAYGERVRAIPIWADYLASNLIVDFRYGDLASSDFPAAIWKRSMNDVLTKRPSRLAYADPRGSLRLRTALQSYLWRARGLQCELEQIIVVNGSQQGLDLCARLFLDSGDSFVIENPCYRMARQVFAGTGAAPVSVAVDGDGLRTDRLSNIRARLAYLTPSHQFPLGGVLPIVRRRQLLDWARANGTLIIEDDYDSEYRYDINPIPPLYGLQQAANVIYLGTISKTLSPSLRIGYLVVPPELQAVFATAKQLTDRHTPVTEQDALASLIESGTYERHLRRVRRLNNERRETLLSALRQKFNDSIIIEGADAGLHVVVWFVNLNRSQEAELVEEARKVGIGIHSISPLYDPSVEAAQCQKIGLVMGYSALNVRQIETGVDIIGEIVERIGKPNVTRMEVSK